MLLLELYFEVRLRKNVSAGGEFCSPASKANRRMPVTQPSTIINNQSPKEDFSSNVKNM